MFRNTTAIIILISLVLHSSCKLGFLDQLYQNRNEIAYTFGLIAEIPIALCSSDYDYHQELNIQTSDLDTAPQTQLQASDINLFFISVSHLPTHKQYFPEQDPNFYELDLYRLTWAPPIFHPPTV